MLNYPSMVAFMSILRSNSHKIGLIPKRNLPARCGFIGFEQRLQ